MSTPPISPPPPPPPPRSRSTLAKAAIAFAVTMVITFGLCSITLISSNSAINGPVFPIALVIEGICVIGLIVVGIMAIARRT